MLSTWLDQHLEEFVRPQLGEIPEVDPKNVWIQRFTPNYLKALRATWDQAKRRSRGLPILLPGRDVFLLEILARMEQYPTEYRQDISSIVAQYSRLVGKNYSNHYVVDTGYSGSVPKRLKAARWDLIRYSICAPWNPNYGTPISLGAKWPKYAYHLWYHDTAKAKQDHQLFPWQRPGGIIDYIAQLLEGVPKYYTRATTKGDGKSTPLTTYQPLSNNEDFANAAILTRHIAEFVVPKVRRKWWLFSPARLI